MNRVLDALITRFGVLGSWASVARIVAWAAVWVVVVNVVISPRAPALDDRERDADVPPSDVRYLGPTSKQDLAGFVAPPDRADDPFVVAWIGGSEVKLRTVSLAGEVANRVRQFGDRPVQIDAYTLLAPRPLDALRAVDAAITDGADAIALSINASWLTDEWSMREWQNLDVANIGTLASKPSTWPWAIALTSPADVTWRVTRGALSTVEAQNRLNTDAQEIVDSLDIIDRPDPDDAILADEPDRDPRLPADSESFWLVAEYGPSVLDDVPKRVATQVEGLADDSPIADALNLRLIRTIEAAGVPAYLYVAPFSPEALTDPDLAAAAVQVEAYWTTLAGKVVSPIVAIEPAQLTPQFADRAAYGDLVHMIDAGPFADVIVGEVCANWQLAHPDRECS